MADQDLIKKVLTIELDVDSAPAESLFLYEDLIVDEDIDQDLDKSHVMYSFYTILGQEFEFKAAELKSKLEKWEGDKWRKLKSSHKRKYTDADAKRKIESSAHRMRTKILISKYEKLYKQLVFGGGRALWMKGLNLKERIGGRNRTLGDFNVREDETVKDNIRSKLKKRR